MSITNVTAYQQAILDTFALTSITEGVMQAQYDWTSAATVRIMQNSLATMGDYGTTGVNRFGTPAELDNTYQDLTLSKDRAFTYTIDKRGKANRGNTIDAGSSLRKNIDWVVVPEVDKYRIAALVSGTKSANLVAAGTALTKTTAYTAFLTGNEALDEGLVPTAGRVAFVAPPILSLLKQDTNFVKASDMGQQLMYKGQIGEVDGVAIIKCPTTLLPTKTDFTIFHPSAIAAPIALADYRTHEDPPGISGTLVEGRWVYDAFVLTALNGATYTFKHA